MLKDEFRTVSRHATARTAMLCATALIIAYWSVPILIELVKR